MRSGDATPLGGVGLCATFGRQRECSLNIHALLSCDAFLSLLGCLNTGFKVVSGHSITFVLTVASIAGTLLVVRLTILVLSNFLVERIVVGGAFRAEILVVPYLVGDLCGSTSSTFARYNTRL